MSNQKCPRFATFNGETGNSELQIISFALPQLMPLLRYTMSSLNRIFVFFEEFLSCRFPYGTYWQVFVDQVKLIFANII
jgi:aminopeptidase N